MKDKTRIEREHRGKIKQISPAKQERLFAYFNRLGASRQTQVTPRGQVIVLTIPNRSPFYLRHG